MQRHSTVLFVEKRSQDHRTREGVRRTQNKGSMRSKRLLNYETVSHAKHNFERLIPDNDTHCDSTEDLLAEIETLNNQSVNPNWKVGSLDIVALYPSLNIPKCGEIIGRELYKSRIHIKNINWKEVMLYLRYVLNDEQLKDKRLWAYVPVRKNSRGRPPTFTSSGSDLNEVGRFKPWTFKKKIPNEYIKKLMFCQAIGILVVETITNHGYQYNSKIFKQEEGGAIGLELVGVVASIYIFKQEEGGAIGLDLVGVVASIYIFKQEEGGAIGLELVGVVASIYIFKQEEGGAIGLELVGVVASIYIFKQEEGGAIGLELVGVVASIYIFKQEEGGAIGLELVGVVASIYIFKQEEGGAIGLELVGVVASIYMCWWDKQLIARTNDAQLILRLYKQYVDDGNVIVDDMQTNTTDEEVIKKVSEIANTIDACIQSTYDYGSKYEDGRVPMLDLPGILCHSFSVEERIGDED